ncbi:hypothetical protein Javan117_0038 [Streptococcus phage Javan117]|uniref:DUF1642 domain-containing protein n=2 Tax=Streptococcus dysgalactiae TaxID=1334 RepID=UPI000824DEB7|nr:DUF1642 domain-containing protein [Streptococcus dysgalactiae]OCW99283.1 hypothetical protein BBG10_01635 [Streptococcus dysgalactiae subsp. equisimilis]QBX14018.1 hypothetical protein Javan117_0038 [Streptococcus phage Javan117]
MNIEEAKKIADKLSVDSDELWKIPVIPALKVKALLDALDQPKPEIPQFVADWIEDCKKRTLTLKGLFSNSDMPAKIFDWIFGSDENCRLMAEAWINGYTVEKEKLYTVEIPNPNREGRGHAKFVLERQGNKVFLVKRKSKDCYYNKNSNHLTEAEIRKDFEWAWQQKFAKEVTE